MFPCIIEPTLKLDVGKEKEQKEGKAFLDSDGKITQEVTVPVSCSSYGALSSCKKWNIPDSVTWTAECKSIRNVKVELFDRERSLSSIDIVLRNNETNVRQDVSRSVA